MLEYAVIADEPARSLPTASQLPGVREQRDADRARLIGQIAIRSLYAELSLYPKPGLVSMRDPGAHADMNAATFIRSLLSLRHYFARAAAAGLRGASLAELQHLGIAAEERMLRATLGINTHRGAIFTLGLLAAAAGVALAAQDRAPGDAALREIVAARWKDDLIAQSSMALSHSHGAVVASRHGVLGARGEAILGFPSVFEIALPALRAALGRGVDVERAQMHAFFSLLARVDDTNVLYRGGARGLEQVQHGARTFLAAGSVFASGWMARALAIHRTCCRAGLSPGGCADLLAAACFVHGLDALS